MLVVQSRRQRQRNVRLCCPLVVARNIRFCCPLVVVLDDAGLAEVQSHTANPAPESLMVNPPVMFVRHEQPKCPRVNLSKYQKMVMVINLSQIIVQIG